MWKITVKEYGTGNQTTIEKVWYNESAATSDLKQEETSTEALLEKSSKTSPMDVNLNTVLQHLNFFFYFILMHLLRKSQPINLRE